jgi:phosphate transport system substrate-binding protein
VGFIRKIMAILLIALSIFVWPVSAKDITISGSSTVMPLAEAAAEMFNIQQHDYVVTLTAGGTGAGITGIAERKYDIAMASREVTPDEIERYGNCFREFKVGLDGISLAVSDRIYEAGIRGLSGEQIRKIYLGNITNWKDIGGPNEDIYVISREEGSGTRDNFNEYILGSKQAETPGVDTVAFGGAEVKTAISGSDRAIGYLGFNYLGGGVHGIAFDGVMPSYDNIKLNLYELHRNLYFYTFGEPNSGAMAFIEFVQGQKGQEIASQEGFIPV